MARYGGVHGSVSMWQTPLTGRDQAEETRTGLEVAITVKASFLPSVSTSQAPPVKDTPAFKMMPEAWGPCRFKPHSETVNDI